MNLIIYCCLLSALTSCQRNTTSQLAPFNNIHHSNNIVGTSSISKKHVALNFIERLKSGKKLAPVFSTLWIFIYHEENRCSGSTNGEETFNQVKIDSKITLTVKNNSEHAWACEKKEEYYYEMVFDLNEKVKNWDRFELQSDSDSEGETSALYIFGGGESEYLKIEINANNLIGTLKYYSEDPG